ncbi:MAG: hypothetical protein V3R73_02725 [Sphingomonadales bacterium]
MNAKKSKDRKKSRGRSPLKGQNAARKGKNVHIKVGKSAKADASKPSLLEEVFDEVVEAGVAVGEAIGEAISEVFDEAEHLLEPREVATSKGTATTAENGFCEEVDLAVFTILGAAALALEKAQMTVSDALEAVARSELALCRVEETVTEALDCVREAETGAAVLALGDFDNEAEALENAAEKEESEAEDLEDASDGEDDDAADDEEDEADAEEDAAEKEEGEADDEKGEAEKEEGEAADVQVSGVVEQAREVERIARESYSDVADPGSAGGTV